MATTPTISPAFATKVKHSNKDPAITSTTPTVSHLYLRYALAGGLCCQATHTTLVPMDVVKTRLQTNMGAYSGAYDAAKSIIAENGVRGLALGLLPTFGGYTIQGAFKFALNEYFKDTAKTTFSEQTNEKFKLPIYLASSAAAECVGTFALCPWEAVRIRMVSTGQSSTINTFRSMAADEGIRGLYKGLLPLLGKQLPYTMTQLTVFSFLSDAFYKNILPSVSSTHPTKDTLSTQQQLAITCLVGTIAGAASAVASHPADTLLSLVNMSSDKSSKTRTISSVLQEIGWKGVWSGLGTRCAMVSILSAGQFLIFDSVKLLCGLPTSGSSLH